MTNSPAWPRSRIAALAVSVVLLVSSLLAGLFVSRIDGLQPGPNDYNVPHWVLRHLPEKWLYAAGNLFRDDLSTEEDNAALNRFFELVRSIEGLERRVSDAEQRGTGPSAVDVEALRAARAERDVLENRVEWIIEGRVTEALKQEGIVSSLGPLGRAVWPPVDFEFTQSPYTLVISPRDRIQLEDTSLLRSDLGLDQIQVIEEEVARRDGVSALAFPTGGVGAYPTLVNYPGSYRRALEIVAHEWVHNHLFFRPLGFRYYSSNDLRTMNETVADLIGNEIAARVIELWPIEPPQAPAPSAPATETPAAPRTESPRLDIGAELRRLREEVDLLLNDGKVAEAEALMEQRREDLNQRGANIRKINQAYFAFVNLYAGSDGSPGATNPIGPKIDQLRRQSGSLQAFVRIVGDVTSLEELDRVLAATGP